MFKNFLALTLAALLATSQTVHADSAPETKIKKGGGCYAQTMGPVGGVVTLKCDHLGQTTVKKLYEQGWRIVASHLYPETATHIFIIEEQ